MACIKVNHRSWGRSESQTLAADHHNHTLYLYWLSRVDYDDQKYQEAIVRLHRVVELDPSMVRAYDLLGLCYDYTGQFDEAIKAFSRAVELNRLQAKPPPWPPLDLAHTQLELNQMANEEKAL